jgi:branched-subunit amino acid ABC-type transport system permease component
MPRLVERCCSKTSLTQIVPTPGFSIIINNYKYLYGKKRKIVREILGNTVPTVENFFHFFLQCYHGFIGVGSFFVLILIVWHVFCSTIYLNL